MARRLAGRALKIISQIPRAGRPREHDRLLEVALDRLGVAGVCVVRVAAGFAQRPALAEQVPASVQLDLHRSQPLLVGPESLRVEVVVLLAVAQVVLLGYEPLDPGRDALVAHGADPTPGGGSRPRCC